MIKLPVTIQLAETDNSPVAELVQIASQYESSIYLETDNKRINAKSIMGMMILRLNDGEEITVSAEGADEAEASKAMSGYLTGTKLA